MVGLESVVLNFRSLIIYIFIGTNVECSLKKIYIVIIIAAGASTKSMHTHTHTLAHTHRHAYTHRYTHTNILTSSCQ